ncbi:MAG: hypothetical protein AAFQ02_08385, partial [Bacteroidota bacterium]
DNLRGSKSTCRVVLFIELRNLSLGLSRELNTKVILIRRFANRDVSMDYYTDINGRLSEFLNTEVFSYDTFAINQKNYRQIMKDQSVNDYRIFFEREYFGSEK